jgi:3-methyladenine DNA glycosylase AlkD
MTNSEKKIEQQLFTMQDKTYQAFQSKLMPNIAPDRIIGIRTPALRAFAKQISGSPDTEQFLRHLPHVYYEENNLHAFLVSEMKEFDDAVSSADEFLPCIDNWATCDSFKPRAFKKNIPALYLKCKEWIASDKTYTIRFGIEMIMNYFLDEYFTGESMRLVSRVRSDEYYVNMMTAWYFATALAKQYESAIVYIEKNKLDTWTHNKAIQKAVESFRVTDEHKKYLRTLRRQPHIQSSVH